MSTGVTTDSASLTSSKTFLAITKTESSSSSAPTSTISRSNSNIVNNNISNMNNTVKNNTSTNNNNNSNMNSNNNNATPVISNTLPWTSSSPFPSSKIKFCRWNLLASINCRERVHDNFCVHDNDITSYNRHSATNPPTNNDKSTNNSRSKAPTTSSTTTAGAGPILLELKQMQLRRRQKNRSRRDSLHWNGWDRCGFNDEDSCSSKTSNSDEENHLSDADNDNEYGIDTTSSRLGEALEGSTKACKSRTSRRRSVGGVSLFEFRTICQSRGNPSLGTSVASTCLTVYPHLNDSMEKSPNNSNNRASVLLCATGLTTGALCVHSFTVHPTTRNHENEIDNYDDNDIDDTNDRNNINHPSKKQMQDYSSRISYYSTPRNHRPATSVAFKQSSSSKPFC